ncbi:MAG: heat-inducible transcriptional repressor HrcA [Bacilli bacterium]
MELSRRDLILKHIVEHFIKTALPVGSHTLIETYQLTFSSATIRNEMLALENDGLLEKTHTSSGRIPSSKGYQYYVDRLRTKSVDERIKQQLQVILSQKAQSVTDIIQKSSEILANMTKLASVVLGPNAQQEKLMSIQVTPLENNSATAVFITDSGYVENKTFVLPKSIDKDSLADCMNLINKRLRGTPVSDLSEKMEAIKPILEDYIAEHDVVYQAFTQAFINFASERLKLYGKDSLFNQPEFAHDGDKLRKVLTLLESPKLLKNVSQTKTNLAVDIGRSEQSEDLSILSSKLKMPGEKESRIALVGPTRMDYDRALSALEYVTEMLEKYFAKISEKDKGEHQQK